jgi:quinol-cytochrome oxidoreductase complex cytochrome b subunit
MIPEESPQTEKKRNPFRGLLLHIHPVRIPEDTLKFTLTWGLGGMTLLLIVLQVITGLMLRFIYEPFPGKAYESIIFLQKKIFFGQLIRNIHHWSATLLIIIIFLHMLRVFLTGAFLDKRRFNWIIGLGLLLCVIFSNFTGYLLPWDQLSYWAITISTSMLQYIPGIGLWLQQMVRGGPDVGPSTLINFYNFHTGILPILIIVLMVFHFWKIRRAGGVILPGNVGKNEVTYVPSMPNLVVREFVVALVLIAFVMVLSILFNAPLLEKANPDFSPNPAKAAWYFLGIQELLMHFHPFFAVLVFPILVLITLVLLPYYKFESKNPGTWFLSKKGRKTSIISTAAAVIMTPIAVLLGEYVIDFEKWLPGFPSFISNGLLPFLLTIAFFFVYYIYLKKRFTLKNNEAIQALFIFLVVTFLLLTFTGIWFRGPGMALYWPWNI